MKLFVVKVCSSDNPIQFSHLFNTTISPELFQNVKLVGWNHICIHTIHIGFAAFHHLSKELNICQS